MTTAATVTLIVLLLLMLGSVLALLRVDRRALGPVIVSAAFVVALSGVVAALLH